MSSKIYEDEESFRQAVEKESRVSVNDSDWSILVEDRHATYSGVDFAEMVNALRGFWDRKPKPSPKEKVRKHRRAHVERAANQTSKVVESYRLELFGHTDPPFPNRGGEAAKWIEGQVEEPQTERLAIEVTIPPNLKPMERVVWLSKYLARKIENYPSMGNYDDAVVGRFMEWCGDIRDVKWAIRVLEYIWANAQGEYEIRCVRAPDGTSLGRLQSIGEQVAKDLDCKLYAAVHHLLTGGIVSHSGVLVAFKSRSGRGVSGDPNPITLTIPDPGSVTGQRVVTAFQKAQSYVAQTLKRHRRQRSRTAFRSERVAAIVEVTPGMSWGDRFQKWNLDNPDVRYRSVKSFREAYYRARDR